MAEKINYLQIPELIEQLKKNAEALQNGALDLEALALMTENSRELYERLVILTYKTGEDEISNQNLAEELDIEANKEVSEPQPTKLEDEAASNTDEGSDEKYIAEEAPPTPYEAQPDVIPHLEGTVADENVGPVESTDTAKNRQEGEATIVEVEQSSFRFDMTKMDHEPPPNQTSLIDAIREEEEKSLNDTVAVENKDNTVAGKLGQSPIANLKDAIAINMKFIFMNDLFEGENNHYNEALEALNNFSSFDEANEYMEKNLATRYSWDMESDSVTRFISLVERRYL